MGDGHEYKGVDVRLMEVQRRWEQLAAYGRALASEYEAQGVPAPDWLAGKLALLAEEIKAAHRAQRLARLWEVEREVEELKRKGKDRQAEADRLRRELGMGKG